MPTQYIISDPLRMSGTQCFVGTRVPVKTLFDYVEGGDSLDVFLEQFPSVSREVAAHVLQASYTALLVKT